MPTTTDDDPCYILRPFLTNHRPTFAEIVKFLETPTLIEGVDDDVLD
jgi:hypothetical protein